MNADMTEDTSVESLPEMEQLSFEVAELKEHSHQSEEDLWYEGVLYYTK